MNDYNLLAIQIQELREAHRRSREKREADRIKAVILLATGWAAEDVAEALRLIKNRMPKCRLQLGQEKKQRTHIFIPLIFLTRASVTFSVRDIATMPDKKPYRA